jgi:hypothetical protein
MHARISNKLALAERYLDSLLASDSVRGLSRVLDEAGEEAQIQGGRLGANLDWLLDRVYRLWNYAGERTTKH